MNTRAIRNHLCELEEKLLKPEIRSSKTELMNILANQFFEIGSSGKVLYKDDDDIGETGIKAVNMKMSDFEIHPLSEEIVLTTYKIFNEDTEQYSLRSSIWKYNDGRWQMYFHQGTKTTG